MSKYSSNNMSGTARGISVRTIHECSYNVGHVSSTIFAHPEGNTV